ncbi:MAG: Ig-like domain-containing protein, partial [Psychrosphaera sp.]|nr:Ig-like domain-containing protein [Psychrosphaera sp.]
ATSTIGQVSPDTGTAITDDNGIALLDLLAGSDVGAGEVVINVITSTTKKAFEIGAAQVTITVSNGLSEGATLSAGATTVISVEIFDVDGSRFIPPLNVEFNSNCEVSVPPKAVLDRNVTSVGGLATATYRADGCAPEDTVTVTVITGGDAITDTIVIPVTAAAIGSIEFVGVSTNYLSLKGTGGQGRSETSVVEFRVRDENNNPASQKEVIFELTNDAGGISISPTTAQSNNDGLVQTVVRSGDVPGAVRVLAYIKPANNDPGNHDNRISAVSDVLIISTGLPDNNSFSLSASILNPEGLNFDGEKVNVNVHLADHFNNPVPDGTAVFFTTEGGAVQPGCNTVGGACTVEWVSQDIRPFTDISHYKNSAAIKCIPYFNLPAPCTFGILDPDFPPENLVRDKPLGGRFTILAHAVGEESFTDLNGNGVFDSGEYYNRYDLSEAFIDHNENDAYDGISCDDASDPCAPANSDGGEFEEFFDFNNDSTFTAADGVYNGYLCSAAAQAAGDCKWEPLHVRRNLHMVMSGSDSVMRVVTGTINGDNTCSNYIPNEAAGGTGVSAILERSDVTGACNVALIDISPVADINDLGVDIGLSVVPMVLYFSDIFNNPMPAGTVVSITTSNGSLSGSTSLIVGSTNRTTPMAMAFTISREGDGNKKTSGALTISVTTPKAIVTSMAITVLDDR